MYEMAKKGREAMRAKAKRLSGEVDQKVDSSNWSPSEPLNTTAKTGMRPVSKSKFKKGGKVTGAESVKHAGRRGRKAGGRLVEDEKGEAKAVAIAKMNRDQKEANAEREGIKHVGGLKHGGRAKKAVGGMPTDAIKKGVGAALSGNTAMKKGGTVKRKGHADGDKVDEIGALINSLPKTPVVVPKGPLTRAEAGIKPGLTDAQRAANAAAFDAEQREYLRNLPENRKRGGKIKRAEGGDVKTPQQQDVELDEQRRGLRVMLGKDKKARGGKARKEGGKVVYGPAESYDGKPGPSTKEQVAQEKKQDAASKPTRGKAQQYADGGAPDPRMGIVKPRMLDFGSGAPGMKKGGKAHDDVAMDKKLIKKMVKPSARTGKFGGGALGGNAPEMVPPAMQSGMELPSMTPNMGDSKPGEYAYGGYANGGRPRYMGGMHGGPRGMVPTVGQQIPPIAPPGMGGAPMPMQSMPQMMGQQNMQGLMGQFNAAAPSPMPMGQMPMAGGIGGGGAPPMTQSGAMGAMGGQPMGGMGKPAGMMGGESRAMGASPAASSPMNRKAGGRAKGKTHINIMINPGRGDQGGMPGGPGGMPPGGPGGPGGVPIPMGMPPGGAPPAAPPMPMPMPMPMPGAPPMGRKAGGRISKVASSYKDMTAGSGSGEGRLQKADIAKRSAHKAGGGVYRSYKDMDAGSGSGLGRLEKSEIQKRK